MTPADMGITKEQLTKAIDLTIEEYRKGQAAINSETSEVSGHWWGEWETRIGMLTDLRNSIDRVCGS